MHHWASPSCWLLWNGSHSKTLLISQSFESFEAMMGVEVGLKCLVPSVWLEWKAPKRFPNLPESSENTDLEQCAPCSACCHNRFHKGKKAVFIQSVWLFPTLHTAIPRASHPMHSREQSIYGILLCRVTSGQASLWLLIFQTSLLCHMARYWRHKETQDLTTIESQSLQGEAVV